MQFNREGKPVHFPPIKSIQKSKEQTMKKIAFISAALLAAFAIACENQKAEETTPAVTEIKDTVHVMTVAEMQARGEYLVNAMGCDDCHSPKKMGPNGPEVIPELRFSGYPSTATMAPIDKANLKNGWVLFGGDLTHSVGPWGASFAANLTSDPTGLGNWSEENFIRAIREGKSKGLENSRQLLPPMPWFVYRNLSDDDLKSIFAFLKTTKPVENVVRAPIPPNEL